MVDKELINPIRPMQVLRLNALSDNYVFVLHDVATNSAAVVDPAEAEPVLQTLDTLGAQLVAIFNTHHHGDHVGGNAQLLKRFPQAIVYASAADRGRIPGQQVFLEAGDTVEFGQRRAQVLFVPGHTRGHIAYYFAPETAPEIAPEIAPETANSTVRNTGELFCGDTLFAGGCGRLFEGTPAQMVASLTQLRQLPDTTRVWCAHEYTLGNLRFAITVDPHNIDLQARLAQVQTQRQNQEPTVPSQLGTEKLTNPFLRWDQSALQAAANSQDPVKTFTRIRGMKDLF
jgi:hydroxyacylglutathione hydrolase